ncbi:hypothetical protein [Streptomyces sodiiphilus]|uniref:hypothetical protein n=1 Tax=Streptomyces sodiiphilus TaxID=226217 RepID=UPI0031D0E05E
MSRARDAALFAVMTAASAFAALTGEPVLGLAGVERFLHDPGARPRLGSFWRTH